MRGLWNPKSSNTKKFNKVLQEIFDKNKKLEVDDFEVAAFSTWTGQRAKEQGYNRVKIDVLKPKDGPPFTTVNVTFY